MKCVFGVDCDFTRNTTLTLSQSACYHDCCDRNCARWFVLATINLNWSGSILITFWDTLMWYARSVKKCMRIMWYEVPFLVDLDQFCEEFECACPPPSTTSWSWCVMSYLAPPNLSWIVTALHGCVLVQQSSCTVHYLGVILFILSCYLSPTMPFYSIFIHDYSSQ